MKVSTPPCLQRRAPASFEIVDRRGKHVPSTLTGYRLKPNSRYELIVSMQDECKGGWQIRPQVEDSFVTWEFSRGGLTQQAQPFRTQSVVGDRFWIFSSPIHDLLVNIEFADGRKPYQMQIPVFLANRWVYAPAALLALASVVSSYKVIGLTLQQAIFISLAILLLFTGVCYALDLWRSYRRTRENVLTVQREIDRRTTLAQRRDGSGVENSPNALASATTA